MNSPVAGVFDKVAAAGAGRATANGAVGAATGDTIFACWLFADSVAVAAGPIRAGSGALRVVSLVAPAAGPATFAALTVSSRRGDFAGGLADGMADAFATIAFVGFVAFAILVAVVRTSALPALAFPAFGDAALAADFAAAGLADFAAALTALLTAPLAVVFPATFVRAAAALTRAAVAVVFAATRTALPDLAAERALAVAAATRFAEGRAVVRDTVLAALLALLVALLVALLAALAALALPALAPLLEPLLAEAFGAVAFAAAREGLAEGFAAARVRDADPAARLARVSATPLLRAGADAAALRRLAAFFVDGIRKTLHGCPALETGRGPCESPAGRDSEAVAAQTASACLTEIQHSRRGSAFTPPRSRPIPTDASNPLFCLLDRGLALFLSAADRLAVR